MTTSDHQKAFTQLNQKPIKKAKFIKFNRPKARSCGIAQRKCKNCGRMGGHINKYSLHICRQCFREMASGLGFKKFS